MNSFDDLQELWQGAASGPAVSAAELIRSVRKSKRRLLAPALGSMLALLATLPVMASVYRSYHPRYPATRLSIILCAIAVVSAIAVQSPALRTLLMPVREDMDNRAMLAALERMQVRQKRINTTFITAYFILLSTAMALYLFEFIRGNVLFGIASYGITFGWIGFAWFYLRPRTIRKQNAALDSMIRQLKSLREGWDE